MEIINKDEFKLHKEEIIQRIKEDGIVFIYPTDTIYGIGCDGRNSEGIVNIRKLKKRIQMPFSVITPSKNWIRENCIVTKEGEKWLKRLPGPYTLIFKKKNLDCVAKNLAPKLETIGVRIPKHWISDFVRMSGIPIVTTSANITGEDFMISLKNLNIDIKNSVDLIIYDDEKIGRPSSIIDLTKKNIKVVER
jgi:tRNA threonylcarbamoyl adenosine modification protein (Sua5/YciO/YrdC/YwlC family)